MHSYSALLSAFFYTLVLLLGIAIVTLVGKWKVYAKLGMPGWYSLIPVFSDYKLCERVRGGEENKTSGELLLGLPYLRNRAIVLCPLNQVLTNYR